MVWMVGGHMVWIVGGHIAGMVVDGLVGGHLFCFFVFVFVVVFVLFVGALGVGMKAVALAGDAAASGSLVVGLEGLITVSETRAVIERPSCIAPR